MLFAALAVTVLGLQADPRYCAEAPARTPSGAIARSTAAKDKFKSWHPCPSTGKQDGACAGWAIDHVIPLACGGCDSPENMQWLPSRIKSASGAFAKDRFERRIYCSGGGS